MLDDFQNIKELRKALLNGDFKVQDLVEVYLGKIENDAKDYNDLILVLSDLARAQAKKIDEKIANKEEIGKLVGVVLVIKDNILVKNYYTTVGSKILNNYTASYDATVIKKLVQEDAVIIAKANMDEFQQIQLQILVQF